MTFPKIISFHGSVQVFLTTLNISCLQFSSAEVLQMTFEHVEWEKWGSAEGK